MPKIKRVGLRNYNYTENNIEDLRPIYCKNKFPDVNLTSKVENLIESHEKISCMVDKAFKTIVANSRNPKFLARLLSNIIDMSYEEILGTLQLSKNEFNKITVNSKGYRGDCVIRINTSIILLEINRTDMTRRNLRYLNSCREDMILLGGEFVTPTSCILVNLNYFTYEDHNDVEDVFNLCNSRGELLTFGNQIDNIYVPLILKKYYNKEELSDLEKVVLIMVLTNIDEAKELARGDDEMMEFIDESQRVMKDKDFVLAYDGDLEEKKSFIAQGREEGIETKENEIVVKLFHKGHSEYDISDTLDIPIDKIRKILNLSNTK